MYTNEQIAYLAGIIDGEGTIYISSRRTKDNSIDYYPRFQVVNTNKELMDWIHKTFCGHLYLKNRSKHNKKWKTQYEWYTNRKIIDELLPLILPYLIAKKPHAKLMLEFRKTFHKRESFRISPEIIIARHEYMIELKKLNCRGVHY